MTQAELLDLEKKITRKKDTIFNFDGPKSPEVTMAALDINYQQIFEQCEIIIFTHDLNGKLLTLNPSALADLGYTNEEISDTFLISLVPDKLRAEFYDNYLYKLRKEGRTDGVMQLTAKNGKRRCWAYHNNIYSAPSEQPYVICFAHNITKRVEAEESLKASNETFRNAFDYSGIGMALINPQGKILDANSAISTFTGYSRDELLQLNFLDLTHPDDSQTDRDMMNKMLIKVINHYSIEKRYISKTRKILWALHTVSKVAQPDGSPRFFILQIIDITRKKQLSDDLNRKKSELDATRSGLVNKISQLEELNYIIAHNLRGPANNIRTLVEMLKNVGKPGNEENMQMELDDIVSFLDEGSSSLLGSLNTLMDVVQISMNKSIAFDECDVRQLVAEILNQLNSSIFEKKAIIKERIEIDFIRYPRVFLESLFYNLISNALKYTSPKRVPEITISTYSINDRVLISVKDNGLGINLDRYGNKIFKLNQTFHPGHDSKGVGLFITKAQIESFGGNIEVKSKEDDGSEFIVTL
jgi:PAS domain S-box-containing protein